MCAPVRISTGTGTCAGKEAGDGEWRGGRAQAVKGWSARASREERERARAVKGKGRAQAAKGARAPSAAARTRTVAVEAVCALVAAVGGAEDGGAVVGRGPGVGGAQPAALLLEGLAAPVLGSKLQRFSDAPASDPRIERRTCTRRGCRW